MTTTIDHLSYPHIFDLIVSYATLWPDPCFNLRAASRQLKDRIDAQLCSHVFVIADDMNVSDEEAGRELDVVLRDNPSPLPPHLQGYFPDGVNFRGFVDAIYNGTPRPWQAGADSDSGSGSDSASDAGLTDGSDSGLRRIPGMKWKDGSAAERAECLRLLHAHTTLLDYSGAGFSVPRLSEAPIFAALDSEQFRMVRGGGTFPDGMHNVRTVVMFATLNTPMYNPEGPYITFISRVPDGVEKLVARIGFDPRHPRIPEAHIQFDLDEATPSSLREVVLIFSPREDDEDFDVPGADLVALRDTPLPLAPTRQPFGLLNDVIMAVAYNLKNIRWTIVGHDQLQARPEWIGMGAVKRPFPHFAIARRFRTTVEAAVRRDEHEFAKWTDDELKQAVQAIRMVPTTDYIDEVGEDEFDLLTEQ